MRKPYLEAENKLNQLGLSDERVSNCEHGSCFAWLTAISGFIPAARAGTEELPFSFVHASNQAQSVGPQQFVPFRGAGHRLGNVDV